MSWKSRMVSKNVAPAELDQLVRSSSMSICLDWNISAFNTKLQGPWQFTKLIGIGMLDEFRIDQDGSTEQFKHWLDQKEDLVLGFFSYELKDKLEKLSSRYDDRFGFPSLHFFVPIQVFIEREGELTAYSHNQKTEMKAGSVAARIGRPIAFADSEEYKGSVALIKEHIQQGDIYEMNYCIEQGFEQTVIEPIRLYDELKAASPAPFSVLVINGSKALIGASPERFMMKSGSRLFSQPMKGTNRRVVDNEFQKQLLKTDPKEAAENVMITDLVRNDLSRSAKKGTVKVDELCEVYEFEHVNTMISTVSAELRENVHPVDAILNAFPMGSMTGAPKIRAMELIDQFESFSRGLYSGAVGYFTPELDFDFNVVIRSVLYDQETEVVTFPTGSAITINSDPAKEYEECMLKAEAMRKVLVNHAK